MADGGVTERGGPQLIPRPELWTPGRPAPWEHLSASSRAIGLDRVRDVFSGRVGEPSPVAAAGGTPSAVLVALYDAPGTSAEDPMVLLTRRSWELRHHRGEVSFPGGRAEPGESSTSTALREAREEVDLSPGEVDVLGELDHLSTVTRRAYIAPVVGTLPGVPTLHPSDAEVAAILHVPLSELTADGVFREERWGSGEIARPVYFFDLYGDTVWGATAAMLRQMLVLLLDLDPGPPEDHDPARNVDWWPLPPGLTDGAF